MKTLAEIKGEIADAFKTDRDLVKAGQEFTAEFMANSILSIVISKGVEDVTLGDAINKVGGERDASV